MIPHHLQNWSRNWAAQAEHPESLYMNRHLFRYPWWIGCYPWVPFPFPPVNTCRPPLNWGLPNSCGPGRTLDPRPLFVPWQTPQPAWFHTSQVNMTSKGDEPKPKRMKSVEDRSGRKTSPKRSYSPTQDFRVPPLHDNSGFPTPSYPVCDKMMKGNIQRKWEDFSYYYTDRSKGDNKRGRAPANFDFTVMSYNILSQHLLEDNSHLYSHCRRPLLFWSFRLPNILKELEQMGADILCLQEVQEDHYRTQIKPSLEALGYHCEYKSRTGTKPDGCAICFKTSKFALMTAKAVEYYRHDITLLDRDNVGLVLLLQPKVGREVPAICVANTHLLYNPRRGDIKLTQLAILLAEIAGIALLKDKGLCPIVLCGDFNSVPGSPLYRFIKEGMLDYGGMTIGNVSGQEQHPRGQRTLTSPIWPKSLGISQSCVYEPEEKTSKTEEKLREETTEKSKITEETMESNKKPESSLQHHFSLSSVYSHFFPGTGVPEITTCHSRAAITVDYIFYSSAQNDIFAQPGTAVSTSGLQLLGRLSLLTEQELWSVNGLPNERNSSDHLSLLAKFRLQL
ncbi:protein angel homolog 2 [Discoglossus pictus]